MLKSSVITPVASVIVVTFKGGPDEDGLNLQNPLV